MRPDYLELMIEESRDLAAFLETLPRPAWDAPSLCRGWRVRDVVSHMAVGHTMPITSYAAALVRHRFSTDDTSFTLAVRFADQHSPEQILATFRAGTSGRPRAAARFVPTPELFTDHLVHHQDIRRPLGAPRRIPSDRAVAALGTLPRLSSRVGSRRRMAGLRVLATDVAFEHGHGDLEVRGTAEALVMALTGRAEVIDELTGSGVALLARRLDAATPTKKAPARKPPARKAPA
jgi:uncharacterized protein (TIGR03083 family)